MWSCPPFSPETTRRGTGLVWEPWRGRCDLCSLDGMHGCIIMPLCLRQDIWDVYANGATKKSQFWPGRPSTTGLQSLPVPHPEHHPSDFGLCGLLFRRSGVVRPRAPANETPPYYSPVKQKQIACGADSAEVWDRDGLPACKKDQLVIAIGCAMGVATSVNIMTRMWLMGGGEGENFKRRKKHCFSYTHTAAKSVCTSLTSTT